MECLAARAHDVHTNVVAIPQQRNGVEQSDVVLVRVGKRWVQGKRLGQAPSLPNLAEATVEHWAVGGGHRRMGNDDDSIRVDAVLDRDVALHPLGPGDEHPGVAHYLRIELFPPGEMFLGKELREMSML